MEWPCAIETEGDPIEYHECWQKSYSHPHRPPILGACYWAWKLLLLNSQLACRFTVVCMLK
jgi:hypothetical protein